MVIVAFAGLLSGILVGGHLLFFVINLLAGEPT